MMIRACVIGMFVNP
ncbi:hypothetical protein Ahy_B09g098894 isoform B [Arachis hypogaea]|uniref:Uncharacterized protein n=1 Tax=Arachis hypogaea TaxID=3818 RepID=A0A444XSH7_ARAHY|nr:hypothetical protein Ahy_B09g098894 isoform B [Arachis hypogaea]